MESNWVLLDVCPFSNHIQIASVKWGALSSTNCCSLSFNSSTLPWHHPARCESTQLAGRAGEIWKQKWSSHVWLNWSQRVHYVSGHYYNISPTYRFPWHKGISLPSLPLGVRSCEVAVIWPDFFSFSFLHAIIGILTQGSQRMFLVLGRRPAKASRYSRRLFAGRQPDVKWHWIKDQTMSCTLPNVPWHFYIDSPLG